MTANDPPEDAVFAAMAMWNKMGGYSRLERMRAALRHVWPQPRPVIEVLAEANEAELVAELHRRGWHCVPADAVSRADGQVADLAAAQQLARELAHEGGDVTEAELKALRERWPPDRSITPVIPETWTDADG